MGKGIIVGGLIFLIGAGAGFAGGILIGKKKTERIIKEKYEEIEYLRKMWKDEIDNVRELHDVLEEIGIKKEFNGFVKIEDDKLEDVPNMVEFVNGPKVIEKEESYTDKMNRRKEELFKPERIQYETFSASTSDHEDIDIHQEVDEELLRQNDDNPATDIYSINPDQFAREEYTYDKITLYWWELERILSTDDMDILDVPDLIGYTWEQHIGEYEKDIVYIRNNVLKTDYEVIVRHESFYEMRGD